MAKKFPKSSTHKKKGVLFKWAQTDLALLREQIVHFQAINIRIVVLSTKNKLYAFRGIALEKVST